MEKVEEEKEYSQSDFYEHQSKHTKSQKDIIKLKPAVAG